MLEFLYVETIRASSLYFCLLIEQLIILKYGGVKQFTFCFISRLSVSFEHLIFGHVIKVGNLPLFFYALFSHLYGKDINMN